MARWSERPEGGNRFWLKLIRWLVLHVPRRAVWLMMIPTTLYFLIVRGEERRASRAWLARVDAPRKGLPGVFVHIHTFAMTICDRVLLLSGRTDALEVRTEGLAELDALLGRGRGCLLLGSHLGSFEAIRAARRDAPEGHAMLRVVMDRGHNLLMTRILEELQPGIEDSIIDARQPGPQIALEAAETIAAGGMVAMLGDRVHREAGRTRVEFLGQTAPMPLAPLAIAGAVDASVFMVFGLYEGGGRYRLVFEPLPTVDPAPTSHRDRRERLNHWVEAYAQCLERLARQYPYNWFNFYDFWNPDRNAESEPGRGPRR